MVLGVPWDRRTHMTVRYIIGDTRDVTATIPDGSIDLIMTSPPFLALRSYLPQDHPDKGREIGSEATPAAFIDMLLELTAEWGRVLAPHGSICVELGDTYSGSGGGGGDYLEGGMREGQQQFAGSASASMRESNAAHWRQKNQAKDQWPLAKSKALIPELYRIALAYGINPLTGQPSPAGRWRVRNVVTWARPNPPVGALGDKYRPATSDLVIACRAADRWFDLDAVRTEHKYPDDNRFSYSRGPVEGRGSGGDDPVAGVVRDITLNPAGAPPLDYWIIPPGGYTGSHYAVYPPELCRIPIQSMCPRQVCVECGKPRRRIVETTLVDDQGHPAVQALTYAEGTMNTKGNYRPGHVRNSNETLGWTDCGCGAPFRPGIVLDPFAGSGTTLLVAHGNSRDAIGIDIDHRNADLATERLGMFITIETHGQDAA
jgi:site-specific DNA-methyltransferase (adenine-specific)